MRRLFWASAGYTLGLGTSLWAQRRVRSAVEAYAPEHLRSQARQISRDLADRARRAVAEVHDAAAAGRIAMRESEMELRAEFAGEPAPNPGVPRHGSSREAGRAWSAPPPARVRHR